VKGGLNEVFSSFASRMYEYHGMVEAAKAMSNEGIDEINAQTEAFEEAETEYLKNQAFEEFNEEDG
jgi:hypothetical protein